MPRRSAIEPVARRAGRPPKFGQPGRLVALTLPQSAIRGLQRIDPDLGWAIVQLLERGGRRQRRAPAKDADLVLVGRRQALIIVNPAAFRHVPGIQLSPFGTNQAFLALEPGGRIRDLAGAVRARLQDARITVREHHALLTLSRKLADWQEDQRLRFRTRAILIAETVKRTRGRKDPARSRR